VPGDELDLRVQYRADVFDAAEIETLMERFVQALAAMTADPSQPLAALPPDGARHRRRRTAEITSEPRIRGNGSGSHAPATLVEQILADIYVQVLGVDRVEVDESFFDLGGDSLSALRAIAAVNAALGSRLGVSTLLEAPTVRSLGRQLDPAAGSVGEVPALGQGSDS
jgi:acyl carrier protein